MEDGEEMSDGDNRKEVRKKFLALDADFEQMKLETEQAYFKIPKRIQVAKVMAKEDIRKLRKKL